MHALHTMAALVYDPYYLDRLPAHEPHTTYCMFAFKVLDNLRYLGLVLSKLSQDFAILFVIWPVLQLAFPRAVTNNFAPRTKLHSLLRESPASIDIDMDGTLHEDKVGS
jgi:hypothetical protein